MFQAYSQHVQSIMHENKAAAKKRPEQSDPGKRPDSRRSDSRERRFSDSRDSRQTNFVDSQRPGHSPSTARTPTNAGSRALDNSGSRTPLHHGHAGLRAQNTPDIRRTGSPALRNRPPGPSVPEDKQYCTACDISLPNHEVMFSIRTAFLCIREIDNSLWQILQDLHSPFLPFFILKTTWEI